MIHFLKNSLMYWGACFHEDGPLCLKCSSPNEMLNTKIEDLASGGPVNVGEEGLPECEPRLQQVYFGSQMPTGMGSGSITSSAVDTNSPYFALGVACVLVIVLVVIASARYKSEFLPHHKYLIVNIFPLQISSIRRLSH